jgi:hypothetical protein
VSDTVWWGLLWTGVGVIVYLVVTLSVLLLIAYKLRNWR